MTWVPFWEIRVAGRSIRVDTISDVAEGNRLATPNVADGTKPQSGSLAIHLLRVNASGADTRDPLLPLWLARFSFALLPGS